MSHCGLGLSCEPLPCEHGKELRKEQCHLCEVKKQIMALTDMYKELSVRVVGFHDFKLRQIDANSKLDKKMQLMKEDIGKCVTFDVVHSHRQMVETWQAGCEQLINGINLRLDEIENGLIKRVGILGQALHELSQDNHKLRKTPHKCPLCDGCGVSGELALAYCQACEGKGIVWG